MEPETTEERQQRYDCTASRLDPLGFTPFYSPVDSKRLRFVKNGLVYDLSAANLDQIAQIEREGRCVVGPTKTPEELDYLKYNWVYDPCYDIEDAEGFEAYRDELLAYRLEAEANRDQEQSDRLVCLAERLGCPGNIGLAEYVYGLERRLAKLESLIGGEEDQP